MLIIYDCVMNSNGYPFAYHSFNTEEKECIQALEMFNNDADKREADGVHAVTSLPGHPEGTRIWDVICNHAEHSKAPDNLKALNLKR